MNDENLNAEDLNDIVNMKNDYLNVNQDNHIV
jgi:hypothetical protein